MDDPELEKIRQQRLAQLQSQHGVGMIHDWGYNLTIFRCMNYPINGGKFWFLCLF